MKNDNPESDRNQKNMKHQFLVTSPRERAGTTKRATALLPLLALAIGCAGTRLGAAESPARLDPSLVVPPYLQAVTPEGASILWRTASPAYGWVEYGTTPELGQRQDWVIDGLRNANTVHHRARLTGLVSGRTYSYRVCWRVIRSFGAYRVDFQEPTQHSETFRFTLPTPKRQTLKVSFLNDLHNRYETFAALAKLIEAFDPEAVFFNGDCFSDPGNEPAVIKALQVYNAGVGADRRPVHYVRGNHEMRDAYARPFKRHFDFPNGEYYYKRL